MDKRVVIVTGGSEGIGHATAERFLKNGDIVIITSRREAEGKKAEKELGALGEITWMHCDVSKEEDCKKSVDFAMEKYGRLDVLVNNAGTVGNRGDLIEQDMWNIENVMKINVMGTLYMIKYAALAMKETGKGVIVNVGSLCGAIVNTESVAYHASKGAVRMITQCMAKELAPLGIRVVSASPGWVATPLLRSVVSEDDLAYGGKLHMTGKIIEPAQIAGAIFILASDDASAINGTTVMADDGYSSFKL